MSRDNKEQTTYSYKNILLHVRQAKWLLDLSRAARLIQF